MSINNTRRRVAANEAARFTAVVVLPTPPFWFATAMIRFMAAILPRVSARLFRLFSGGRSGFVTRESDKMALRVELGDAQ